MIFTSAEFIRMTFNKFCTVITIKLPPITIKGKKHFLRFQHPGGRCLQLWTIPWILKMH